MPYIIRIMEAAHRAPTGSNVQSVEFTLVRSADKIREIADYTASVFEEGINAIKEMAAKNGLKEDDPKIAQTMARIGRLIGSYRKGYDGIMRNATAAIFIHAPHSCRTGDKDCNLAYQNASLMAEAMGISQFYAGFVCAAYGQDKSKGLNKILGTDNYIYAGIALGIPKYRFKKYMDKQPLRFNEI